MAEEQELVDEIEAGLDAAHDGLTAIRSDLVAICRALGLPEPSPLLTLVKDDEDA